jgi:NADP-dependent 3-hydroxy acid dehydrogenase YdfG
VFANAGLTPAPDIASLKVDEWNRMVDVTVKGVLNTAAAVLPILAAKQSGHIIATSVTRRSWQTTAAGNGLSH